MKIQKLSSKLIFWCIILISLVNIIWLISIPGEEQNWAIFSLSIERLMLVAAILFPVIILIFVSKSLKRSPIKSLNMKLIKFGNLVSLFVLLMGFFFLLIPINQFRFTFNQAIWLRLLPVAICYISISFMWVLSSVYWLKNKIPSQTKVNNREDFIDFTRGFAILLALASHSYFVFGFENIFGDAQYLIKSLTRFATPIFIIITGIMLELVYLRKAQKSGFHYSSRSLLIRSAQCYIAYLVTVLVEWFNHLLSNDAALYAVLFIGKSLFSGILKFYTLLLLLSIFIIWIRQKAGIWIITILPIIVWLGAFFMKFVIWPIPGSRISYLTALVFGHPSISSFSVWHAITFLSFGMLLGFWIKFAHQTSNWKRFYYSIAGIFLLNLMITLIAVYPFSLDTVVFNFANDYRNDHNIAYYSIGSMAAMVFLWFFYVTRSHLNRSWLRVSIISLGKNSLWAFAAGNSLAAIFPGINNQPPTVIIFTLSVWFGTILIIYYKNFLLKVVKFNKNVS